VSLFHQSYNVNVLSLFNFLEAIRILSLKTRLFYAASSHLFGKPVTVPQDETTLINPLTIYGITKASGLYLRRAYRSTHKVFASVGILYNHESWLRGEEFVSRKIVRGVIRCKADPSQRLILGDLGGEVDWGFAPDYVDAIQRILSLEDPDDFIIATGEKHTVEEFARIAFEAVGLDWREFVEEQREIITRPSVPLIGNSGKLIRKTGWRRSLDFSGLVQTLVKKEGEAHER
jgi:GDPmannose 4,6-dehydratase